MQKSTISLRLSVSEDRKPVGQRQTFLVEEEAKLAKNLEIMAKWGYAYTKKMILGVVTEYIEQNNINITFKDTN